MGEIMTKYDDKIATKKWTKQKRELYGPSYSKIKNKELFRIFQKR